MKINSKQKGARGEREFAEFLRSFGIEARRGIQFRGGEDSPDVISDLDGVHFEVKRTEKFSPGPAFEQACRDAGNKIPVVVTRKNGGEWMIYARASTIISIMNEFFREQARVYGTGTD